MTAAFIAGIVVGTPIGVAIMCWFIVARDADDRQSGMSREG